MLTVLVLSPSVKKKISVNIRKYLSRITYSLGFLDMGEVRSCFMFYKDIIQACVIVIKCTILLLFRGIARFRRIFNIAFSESTLMFMEVETLTYF